MRRLTSYLLITYAITAAILALLFGTKGGNANPQKEEVGEDLQNHSRFEPHNRSTKPIVSSFFVAYFFFSSAMFDAIDELLLYLRGAQESQLLDEWSLILQVNSLALLLTVLLAILVKDRYLLLPLIGAPFGSVGLINSTISSVSIITVAWHGAIGFFASLSLFFFALVSDLSREFEAALPLRSRNLFKSLKEDLWSVIRLIAQVFLAFAFITGVCMTILFAPGYSDPSVKILAIKMVVAFGFCAGGLYFWGLAPVLKLFAAVCEAEVIAIEDD